MVDDIAALGAILVMALVTLATRLAGVWIMSYVEITARIQAFLKYMATSVFIAIVVPAAVNGAPRIGLAVGAAAVAMIASRSALAAMLIGAAVAAAAKSVGL
jgi:uncharacterized membrane protein